MRSSKILKVAAVFAAVGICGIGSANVWMDERFEDGPFTQGNGVFNAVPSAELDKYSGTQPMTATVTASPIAHTGSVVGAGAFEGTSAYTLASGQTLSVGATYQDPQNGNMQIFQFAVKVNPIPAAGTVGEFRWNHDYDNATAGGNNSFFVRLVSTGTSVNIIGGEDVANVTPTTASLGTLANNTAWAYITMILNKDSVNHTDARANVAAAYPGPGGVTPGMHFHRSSNTSSLNVPLQGGAPATFRAGTWAFTVSSGTVWLDDIYWDGGLDDNLTEANVRPFTKTSTAAVEDWALMM